MFLTCIGYALGTVALGYHDERTAVGLELINIRIHTSCCRGTHGTTWISFRSLGRTGIQDRVVLEILWHALSCVETGLDLCMCNITAYNNGSLEIDTGRNRVLAQFPAYGVHAHVQIYLDTFAAFTRVAQFLGNQLCRVLVHLLYPDTVLVDLCLDIAVCTATDAHTYRQ